MKTKIFTTILLAIIGLSTAKAQVGIGTTTPDASSALEIQSTTKGLLPPRMTTTQRNAINNGAPATGLVIFNTTVNCLQWFNGFFWYNACDGTLSPTPNGNLTVANVTYQGVSVINSQGIGYNDETVLPASTITVNLTNSSSTVQNYGLIATHPATGLVYSASGTIAGSATISVVLNNNSPTIAGDFYGAITMPLLGASSSLNLEPRIDIKSIPTTHPDWTFNEVVVGTQRYLDRNLGARRVATAINDPLSYGNAYQWGRPADGHEILVINGVTTTEGKVFAGTTTTLSATDNPGNALFIIPAATPFDWRTTNNPPGRWRTTPQGPCPAGYHVPTLTEAEVHLANNTDPNYLQNRTWAFTNSPLKLPSNGYIDYDSGRYDDLGAYVNLWYSSTFNEKSEDLGTSNEPFFDFGLEDFRGWGIGVRCIKD